MIHNHNRWHVDLPLLSLPLPSLCNTWLVWKVFYTELQQGEGIMLGVRTRLALIPGFHFFPTCLKQVKSWSVEIRGKSHFLSQSSISFQGKETELHRGKTANKKNKLKKSNHGISRICLEIQACSRRGFSGLLHPALQSAISKHW